MAIKNRKVDIFLSKEEKWLMEYKRMRSILLATDLTEDLKWGQPCYTYEGGNVIIMHGFKEYFAIMFMKGSLLKDPKSILITQTANVQSARQMRFTSVAEIIKMEATIEAYIKEALKIEKSGLKVEMKSTSEFEISEEFRKKLGSTPGLKAAFKALTPGRQRGYLLYFSAAKQSKTREARVEKYLSHILAGKGLDD